MKVTVEEGKGKVKGFVQGKLYISEKGLIVMCTETHYSQLIGTALNGTASDPEIGYHYLYWVSEVFKEFHGKVTIEQE